MRSRSRTRSRRNCLRGSRRLSLGWLTLTDLHSKLLFLPRETATLHSPQIRHRKTLHFPERRPALFSCPFSKTVEPLIADCSDGSASLRCILFLLLNSSVF